MKQNIEEYVARTVVIMFIVLLVTLWVYPIDIEVKASPIVENNDGCIKKYEIYQNHCNNYLKLYPSGSCDFLYNVYKKYCP